VTRFVRRIASALAASALVFGQLAMAVHACERLEEVALTAPQAAHDCCEKPMAPANDCERHCDYAASSVDTHGASMTVAAPATPVALRVEAIAFGNLSPRAVERPLDRRVDPPPLKLFGVLRI
jgi:hypothetical protein